MEKSKKSINVEVGFLFCGGWNFSKLVSMGPTFIREMRVLGIYNFGITVLCSTRRFPDKLDISL